MTTAASAAPPGHAPRLTIDLDALCVNWRLLADRCAPGECASVVKADAYGIGIEAAVPALATAGCRTFFVAHLSEALRARAVAPGVTIYVLNGLPTGVAPAYVAAALRPVIGSTAELADWQAGGQTRGYPVAIHVDTGMNRLGFRPEEITDIVSSGVLKSVPVSLVMSHFIASEVPGDPSNARQTAAFVRVRALFPNVTASLANSSGFFLGLPTDRAMFRAGYALYGGNPEPGRPNPMRAVVRLDATIIDVRAVPAGETVGYNSTWRAARASRIAVASIGYADGLLRAASPDFATKAGAEIRVGGTLCRLAGRISMDLIAIDVTDVPGNVARGDLATLLDEDLTVDHLAAAAGTNGYEILTSLGRRHERRYTGR